MCSGSKGNMTAVGVGGLPHAGTQSLKASLANSPFLSIYFHDYLFNIE